MIPIPRGGCLHAVEGMVKAKGIEGVEEVTITAKIGQALVPPPEGSSYLGFIFARAGSPEAVEAALRAAHARLDFQILAKLPMTR